MINSNATDGKKPSWEWVEEDLLSMKKAQTQESLYLEFKRSASLSIDEKSKVEISKDISAFANSDGGEILYGVSETGKPPARFGDIDEGIDITIFSPEWFENIINSRIQPRINGIRINLIELKTVRPGKFVYCIHIPSSENVPHQASDRRYYKRYNFQSVPMEDYEIRDVRNRQQKPKLQLYCEILTSQFALLTHIKSALMNIGILDSAPVLVSSFKLRIWIANTGIVAAKRPQIIISFDNLNIKKNDSSFERIDDIREDKPSIQWTGSNSIIYPHSRMKVMDLTLGVNNLSKTCVVNTEICAEDIITSSHRYEFLSSELVIANFYDVNGKKYHYTLDTIEDMLKRHNITQQ